MLILRISKIKVCEDLCDLLGLEGNLLSADLNGDIAVLVVSAKHAAEHLSAVSGGVQSDLNVPALAGLDMLCGLQLALDSGRGNLQDIRLADGIRLVQNGVDGSVELFAILDGDAVLIVDGNAEIFIRALRNVISLSKISPLRRENLLRHEKFLQLLTLSKKKEPV